MPKQVSAGTDLKLQILFVQVLLTLRSALTRDLAQEQWAQRNNVNIQHRAYKIYKANQSVAFAAKTASMYFISLACVVSGQSM